LNRDQKKITQFKNRDFVHVLSLFATSVDGMDREDFTA